MFSITHKGDFSKTTNFLDRALRRDYLSYLRVYGERGVSALRSATPRDSGITADSWDYKIVENASGVSIVWTNEVDAGKAPLAVMLQYGHGTRNGGYVQGRDYINPALQPIFDEIAKDAWNSLTR